MMTNEQLVETLKNSTEFQMRLAQMEAAPQASTDPEMSKAIDNLIKLLGPLLPVFLPLLIPGLPPAAVPVIIQIIAQLLGVDFDTAQAMLTA